jgi:hypothetical protein
LISKESHPLARILVPIDKRQSRSTRCDKSGGMELNLKMMEFGAPIARVTGSAAKIVFLR